MSTSGLMKGKRGLIMGVANDRSIAWGIAEALHGAGAELAFTYQGDVFKKRVMPLVEPLNPAALIDCDVSEQGSIDAAFAELRTKWDSLDFVVHAIAFSDKEQLKGRYVDTTPENFAHDDEHLLLFVHRGGAARGEDDDQGRPHGDAHLLRRRESHAALQCDGRGQGGAGSERALHGRGSRQEARSASIRFRRGRSRRWRRRASAISATS